MQGYAPKATASNYSSRNSLIASAIYNTMSPATSVTITSLSQGVHRDNVEKGFYDTPKEEVDRLSAFVANVHGETSELWEAVRKGTLREPCDKNCGLTNMEEEMADIIIRVLDTAGFFGLDIGEAIRKKLEYNRTRPRRHGGKLA